MVQPYLECGQIINTHGVRGTVKVDPWGDSAAKIAALPRVFLKRGDGWQSLRVTHASVFKQFVLMDIEGVTDLDAAMAMRGTVLHAAREDFHLEPGQYFWADMVGVPVYDDRREGDCLLGTVKEIMPGVASGIYVINTDAGEVMVPAVPAFIKKVEPGEYVRIAPIDGMFPEDKPSGEDKTV